MKNTEFYKLFLKVISCCYQAWVKLVATCKSYATHQLRNMPPHEFMFSMLLSSCIFVAVLVSILTVGSGFAHSSEGTRIVYLASLNQLT